jgi:hypothetical protein
MSRDLLRRREAARRLPPLECGCSDPWPCRRFDPPPSSRSVDGYRDAALHLLAEGLIPAPNIKAMRELWRRGRDEQNLARTISELWEKTA